MSKSIVQIDLSQPAGPYYPGDEVQAVITLQVEKEMAVRGATACLALRERYTWQRTSNKGRVEHRTDTEEAVYAPVDLVGEGTIPPGQHTYPVTLRVPAHAIAPYAGKITCNAWWLKVKFDCPKAFDPEAEVELPLIVPPPGLKIEPGEYGRAEHSDEAGLGLWLPRLEWIEGETIEGKVLVRAQADFSVTEVRLELILTEHVPRASTHTHTHCRAKLKLADSVDFWPAQPAEFPFSLPLPGRGLPTRSSSFSTATWTLKAILARRLRQDPEIAAEIELYNGPARS